MRNTCECKCVQVCVCVCAQSCPTLCNPMDCSPPGSSVHGVLQARILEWVAISYSKVSSQGSNLYLLHWSADSLPLGHLGSSWPWGSLVTSEGGFLCSWPLCQYIERFYTGTSNYVLGSKQSWNTAHWQTGECHRVYHNFTHDKTKSLYEYKQWHKIKDYIPKVLILLFVELGLVNFISNLKMHFAYFIVKLLIYSFPGSSVFLREPNPLLYVPSVTSY